jgi:hypothetical protein
MEHLNKDQKVLELPREETASNQFLEEKHNHK